MCKVCLWRLTVIMCSMTYSSTRGSNCQSTTIKLVSCSISKFCSFIYDLIKCWKNIICKLNFSYCCLTYTGLIYNYLTIPIPKATIPYSHKGVLKTLSSPYFLFKSREHLKTPPNLTSSPNRTALYKLQYTCDLFIARYP